MRLNREQLAWAAGVFDGEGCAYIHPGSRGSKVKYLGLSVTQNGTELLTRFQKAVGGLGKIYAWGRKPLHRCIFQKFEQAQAVVAMLWPWLTEIKKLQIERAMTAAKEGHALTKTRYIRAWETRRGNQ